MKRGEREIKRIEMMALAGDKQTAVRLPILNMEKFDGDPFNWQTFIDTSEASTQQKRFNGGPEIPIFVRSFIENSEEVCGGFSTDQ